MTNLEAITPLLKQASVSRLRILDYGSGWGTLLLRLRRWPADLFCYDIDPAAVTGLQASASMIGVKVFAAEMKNGKLAPNNYYMIICSHVLEHVEEKMERLREFHKALRGSGHLLLNVPINEVWDDPGQVRQYSKDGLENKLAITGFRTINSYTVDRWTAFLLTHAKTKKLRVLLRVLRGLLAIVPLSVTVALGEILLRTQYPHQQFIVSCRKLEKQPYGKSSS